MWEYEVQNKETKETCIIYGYNFMNACYRAGLSPDTVYVVHQNYVD